MTVKLLSGGGMPPFVYYKPVTTTRPSGTTAQSVSTTKSDELSNKDLLKTLDKIDGLPSDMAAIKDSLVSAISSPGIDLFGSSSSLFGTTGLLATLYANTLLNIKIANFSKKKYDDIKKILDQNGGLNEVAVTDTGGVIVSDNEGNIKPISVDEYLQNKNKYRTLTNSNILYMRAYNTNYANNDQLMSIAGAGIGLTEINKQIKAALGRIGSSELSKESYQVLQGAEVLKEIYEKTGEIKLEGLYKIKNTSSNQSKLAKAALDYIWGMLPENAKAVLKIKSGGTKEAYEMIAGFVASGTSDKFGYSENYILDAEGNKPGSLKKEGGSAGKYKPGVVSNFINGNGKTEAFTIMNGTTDGIVVTGISAPLTNNAGKVAGPMSIYKIQSSGFSGVLDFSNVSIGGVHVNNAHLSELMCTDGQIHSVDFPSTRDQQGNIVPNYKLFAAKEAADREIVASKATTPEEKNAIYKKHNLPIKYDSEGNIITENWTRFAVLNGVAIGRAFEESDQSFNDLLQEVDDRDLEGYLKYFNDEAKISGTSQANGKDIEYDKPGLWDKFWGKPQNFISRNDLMFKGTIFIPIVADEMGAMAGDNSHTTVGENLEIAGLIKDREMEEAYNDPGGLDE